LNEQGLAVVVVSNQSGLARGYFPESLLEQVHVRMVEMLAGAGAHVDGIYICPHHPEAKEERFRLACDCRKPRPGLFLRAAADLDLDPARSYVVGDRWSDLKAAAAVRAKGVLVLTGYGRGDYEYLGPGQTVQPAHVAEDLYAAVEWIVRDMAG
jgi:D-glycero-D-manno-heptose 1,7-bisphosphate phosphatase